MTSQISAVFGGFRWAYEVEKGLLFYVFETNILPGAGNSYYFGQHKLSLQCHDIKFVLEINIYLL